jgi:ABC-2 type transport system permease protein
MARRDPLLPNAGIVASREYRDKVRGKLYLVSTVLLMVMAVGVALTPITLSYLDRRTQTAIAVVAGDADLRTRAVAVTDSVLNARPPGIADEDWTPPFIIGPLTADEAALQLGRGHLDGILLVERRPDGQVSVVYRTNGIPDQQRTQLVSVAAFGLGVIDWSAALPADAGVVAFRPAAFEIESIGAASDGGQPIDTAQLASRTFLGTVFIILMFISILIYGMWVATGVATEKSSRVMELMISAASPRQLVLGKVVGIGAAGLTQYAAVAIPALLVLAFQEQLARAMLGPGGVATIPTGGLTLSILLAYGFFLLLGFTMFAFVYAAVGSFVSRPDDLQTLSLPLSLIAMAGYLSALPILLSGTATGLSRILSLVPPFSPFAMLARVLVTDVPPGELALSVALLLAAIVGVAIVAVRMYTAGVLLYGQRPTLRAFFAAARRV